ncbi:MAG: hypothetical protein A3F54_00065 [Candidatus Kerfeldbacteria bacterium RIFCSPHIGHO2_12_FULL_48_17]|uniref:DEAD/DEAH box helicase n=1 Tax=Candidatus Kerfeldbacteria bacterium RIFCSPHIGHO2_12_FULL_48_17 TaxID=1798542 RepID=A0A1G2B9H1_9BACT|nr:MAG: hypothetical protein A3F54_00065 [Candidatus Kerfeldbacteria bacterium RIFCSPHIGHO2_12_FULL_48_17]
MNTHNRPRPQPQPVTIGQFQDLGIAPKLLSIIANKGFATPTAIQHQVIPTALEGKDVVGIAQTGTGKTLAFGIPMIQRLATHKGQGLIIVPTRELALQVAEALQNIGTPIGLRSVVLIGGAPIDPQSRKLRNNPHIIVATPGRLMDHMKQGNYSLSRVSILVLDEADRMFDIGFQKEIIRILTQAPRDRQTMLFSATMPEAIAKLAAKHMQMPFRIEVAPQGTAAKNVEQEVFIINKPAKLQLLEKLLGDIHGSILIFSRTKHGAKKITRAIATMGHTAAEIHSNRSLSQRRAALEGFKMGKYRVLVATDIAARGIDVENISAVINFDLPDNAEDYVHRIGRTGRAGRNGRAISFATPQERADIRQIQRLIRKTLPVVAVPELPEARPEIVIERQGGWRGGNRNRGGGGGGHGGPNSRNRGGNRGFGGNRHSRPSRNNKKFR